MFLHPNSAPLWREYLLFTQSYFSSFAVSKVNAAYGKCLSTLSAVRDGSMVSHPSLPGIEEDMLGKRCGLLSIHSSLLCHLGKKRVLCFYVKYIFFFFSHRYLPSAMPLPSSVWSFGEGHFSIPGHDGFYIF